MYLVDTNIVSERAPLRSQSASLASWMDANAERLFLSVVTVAEIEDGIAKARREGATRKAHGLAAWLETLLHLYAKRILAFGTEEARIAGALSDLARGQG